MCSTSKACERHDELVVVAAELAQVLLALLGYGLEAFGLGTDEGAYRLPVVAGIVVAVCVCVCLTWLHGVSSSCVAVQKRTKKPPSIGAAPVVCSRVD